MSEDHLPEGWKRAKLGEVCSVQTGFPFKSEFFDGAKGTPLVRVRSLKAQHCDIFYNNTYDSAFVVRNGDILIGMDGDFQPCCWKGGIALLNQRVARLVNFKGSDSDFLFHAAAAPLKQLEDATHFTTVKHLSSSGIQSLPVVLPPLLEQKAIAETLRTVQDAQEARHLELSIERERKAALMDELFRKGTQGEPLQDTELGKLPISWRVVKLGEVVSVKGGKRLPKGEQFAPQKTAFPYIRVVDFKNGRVDTTGLQYLTEEIQAVVRRYIISKNDVYISIAGSIGLVGVIPEKLDGANLTENAAKICPSDSLDRDYLAVFLASEPGQNRISNLTSKTTQPKLALARIEQIQLPFPPLNQQKEIAAILRACDDKISVLEAEVAVLDELFRAMLEELMSGRLRSLEVVEDCEPDVPDTETMNRICENARALVP